MERQLRTKWFNYVPLSGVGPELKDDGSRVFCSVPIDRGDGSPLELAFIGDASKLELLRVGTPSPDGDLSQEERHIVGNLMDHALSVLRLLYGNEVGRLYLAGAPFAFGQMSKEDGSPQLIIKTQQFYNPPQFDAEQLRNALVATAPIRVQLSLLAEAAQPTIPLSFRYLCYYKILELELRQDRKWVGLDDHLQKYEEQFRKLEIGASKLSNFLHSYRNKCAHIKTGGRDELGLTGMGSRDGEIVSKFLPLFRKITFDLINEQHGRIIQMAPIESTSSIVDGRTVLPSSA
jgi:hypothetical protein